MNEETPDKAERLQRHLNEAEMAKLIDDSLDLSSSEALLSHLRGCPRCQEILKDTCLSISLWETNPEILAPTPDTVDAGMRVAGTVTDRSDGTSNSFLSFLKSGSRRRIWYIPAAAALVLLLIARIWIHDGESILDNQVPPSTIQPVQRAIETVSRWGPMVLPGGEHAVGGPGVRLRSGYVRIDDSLKSSLSSLYDMYQQGNVSPDVVYYLTAGYVATGQIDMARNLVQDARERGIADTRSRSVEALVAFIDGDLEAAERIYREISDSNPDDLAAATNLAVILKEQGRYDEASRILSRIRATHPGSSLAQRAEDLLGTFPRQ